MSIWRALLAAALATGVWAQEFEVASIRPSRGGTADSNVDSLPSGRLTATNITVRELILLAFDVKDYQIEHAPGWIENERYDIQATGPVSGAKLETERTRIRALLADRFHLRTHRERRQTTVYVLAVDRGGSKLKAHNDGAGTRTRRGCGHLAATRVTTGVIATMLSRLLERDVIDRTGLDGKFDFELDWTPDAGPCPAANGGEAPFRGALAGALREQLGLKLETAKGTAEFIVIDGVERPTEN